MKKAYHFEREFISSHGLIISAIDISFIFILIMSAVCFITISYLILGIILGAVIFIVYLLCMFLYLPLYYRELHYSADNEAINIKRGIFIHRRMRISLRDVQYCVISQGIIQRIFKTYSVYIMLTGSFSIISHISLKDAERIRNMTLSETITKQGEYDEKR